MFSLFPDSQVVTFNLWCMNPAVAFAAVRNESRVISMWLLPWG